MGVIAGGSTAAVQTFFRAPLPTTATFTAPTNINSGGYETAMALAVTGRQFMIHIFGADFNTGSTASPRNGLTVSAAPSVAVVVQVAKNMGQASQANSAFGASDSYIRTLSEVLTPGTTMVPTYASAGSGSSLYYESFWHLDYTTSASRTFTPGWMDTTTAGLIYGRGMEITVLS